MYMIGNIYDSYKVHDLIVLLFNTIGKSTYKKPTLNDLLVELTDVNLDSFLLGVGLKVPVDILNQIEQECKGYHDTKFKQKVCKYWLKCCPDDTWEEVVVTLMRTGYNIRELIWKLRDGESEGKN